MEYRQLGRTDLRVSEVGFGCGSVGGLMVRGDRDEMTRAVALASAAKGPLPTKALDKLQSTWESFATH